MLAEISQSYPANEMGVLELEDQDILQTAFEEAWEFMPPRRRTRATRYALAAAIARLAAHGNYDPGLLSIRALSGFIPEVPCAPL
jgi:hypothetical protein